MKRVAVVIQRYHETVVGGAETLARQWVALLRDDYDIQVLTASSTDAGKWENDLPAGDSREEGIAVRRFSVEQGRTPYWHALHDRLKTASGSHANALVASGRRRGRIPWTLALQEEFITKQGPYCPGLLDHLAQRGGQYDTILFFTYLFPTTYWGIWETHPAPRKVLVPTLHDEPPAYLPAYRRMAEQVDAMAWNTDAESRLCRDLWGDMPGTVVGMAIDAEPRKPEVAGYPYLLYSGRIDSHKGCDQLLEYFLKFVETTGSELRLVLTGKDEMGVPAAPGVEMRGYVTEEEKFRLMAGATAFVMPSRRESLSIVTLEAMAQGTPALVNGASDVLAEHIRNSGGGLIYTNFPGFADGLRKLTRDRALAETMGNRGRDYVTARFRREAVKARMLSVIAGAGGGGTA